MATVTVSSFAEFLTAAAVSGDTVVLPEDQEWEIDSLYPEGYTGNISLNCAEIRGNGTAIKNLHLHGVFLCGGSITFSGLKLLNLVCDGSGGTSYNSCIFSAAGYYSNVITLDHCTVSALCGSGIQNFAYQRAVINACSINVQFTGAHEQSGLFSEYLNAQYSRLKMTAPNYNPYQLQLGYCSFCELNIIAPNVPYVYAVFVSACKIIGNLGTAELQGVEDGRDYLNIFSLNTMPHAESSTWFAGVTDQQMTDAAYLASIGFPVGA